MRKPIYSSKGWVLGICGKCGRLNYVEPHGTTAECRCSKEWTEHQNVPQRFRNDFDIYIGPSKFEPGYPKEAR